MIQAVRKLFFRLVGYPRASIPRHDPPDIARDDSSFDRAEVVIAAHDCLTLLDIMTACANRMHGSNDDVVEFHKVAERMRHLARRLVADEPAQPVRQVIDMNHVITESQGMAARMLSAGTRLRLELADAPATVKAERWEIERLLLNLVLNACRRGLRDGSEIVIQTASMKQVPPGLTSPNIQVRSYISLTVSVASAMERRGGRVIGPAWNMERRGSDLTLAAVARTVQQLEGTLQMEIDSDRYMRVRVDLPLVIESSDDAPDAG